MMIGDAVRHGYKVSFGTCSMLTSAASPDEARGRVAEAWGRVNGREGISGLVEGDLVVTDAQPGDWRKLDYWSGASRDEPALVRLFNPDDAVT